MDKLQWFKFTPTDWVMGKIQRCPEVTQARFMRLICLYWNKECVLSYDDAEIEIDKEHLDILISKKIIKNNNNLLIIEFLNEQLESISETSQKRREAVLQRWNKVKQNNTSVLNNNTNVLQNDTDKSREELEKKRKELLDKSLLSEIKISDDKKGFLVKEEFIESTEQEISYFKTAESFRKLFIKNLKEKNAPTKTQETVTFKNYVTPIRLMIEKKEVTIEQLRDAYNYLESKEGEFWKTNILSTEKLRKNISMLLAKKNQTIEIAKGKNLSQSDFHNKRKRFA